MSNENKQTAMQQLKCTLKNGLGNMIEQSTDYNYKSGFKLCLREIENLIDKQLLEIEKQQIEQTYDDAIMKGRQEDGEQYYNETYGGNK